MATQPECERWIGDTKSEHCSTAGAKVTQTYSRRDTKTEIQYGWSCSCCGKFLVTRRFAR